MALNCGIRSLEETLNLLRPKWLGRVSYIPTERLPRQFIDDMTERYENLIQWTGWRRCRYTPVFGSMKSGQTLIGNFGLASQSKAFLHSQSFLLSADRKLITLELVFQLFTLVSVLNMQCCELASETRVHRCKVVVCKIRIEFSEYFITDQQITDADLACKTVQPLTSLFSIRLTEFP